MSLEAVTVTSARQAGKIELEGALHLPQYGDGSRAAILCHPHPEGGGDMDVPLLLMLADELAMRGLTVLRFNFGGVGRSGGSFSDGVEEVTDLRAAFDYVAGLEQVDRSRISLNGWSFGAWMALIGVSHGIDAEASVAIAPPFDLFAPDRIKLKELAASRSRRRYILGDADQYCSRATLGDFALSVGEEEPRRIEILPGVDHFLAGAERRVLYLTVDFLVDQAD